MQWLRTCVYLSIRCWLTLKQCERCSSDIQQSVLSIALALQCGRWSGERRLIQSHPLVPRCAKLSRDPAARSGLDSLGMQWRESGMRTAGGGKRRKELDERETRLPVGGFCELSLDADSGRTSVIWQMWGTSVSYARQVRQQTFLHMHRAFIKRCKKEQKARTNNQIGVDVAVCSLNNEVWLFIVECRQSLLSHLTPAYLTHGAIGEQELFMSSLSNTNRQFSHLRRMWETLRYHITGMVTEIIKIVLHNLWLC